MLHYRFARKLILIVGALIASAIFADVLTPAASEEIRPLLQSLGIISCSSPNPCQEGTNASTGAGLEGISAKGKGVIGQTSFASTSSSNGQSGVIGSDVSTSGAFDSGVRGTSVRGNGISGASTSGTGVLGTGLRGIKGENTASASSDAIFAKGLGGRLFRGNNHLGQDVFVVDDGGNATIAGNTVINGSSGLSVHGSIGVSQNGTIEGGLAVGGGLGGVSGNPLTVNTEIDVGELRASAQVAAAQLAATQLLLSGIGLIDRIQAFDSTGNFVFQVTNAGDVHAHSFTSDLAATRIQPTATGRKVQTYAQQSSQPSLEDFGEAQLVNGQAYVRLSPDFANVIDQRSKYLVVVTPEGPSRGLYVTQETPVGFAVMENPGGHSTLAFSYRIVAKPLGSREARLPMVELPRLHERGRPTHARPLHLRA